ncbi:D-alanyl-D-alanine carboxypeptidase, partial [uncultured Bartonella sp.]|uniref:D-alanyl-D-alanine carboxypeptidase n=1 Tax=uncultured Bartonella sp. TaxID=104108 RepID=UPI00261AAD8C
MQKAYQKVANLVQKTAIATLVLSMSIAYANAAPQSAYAEKYAAIVVDANTGRTLFEVNGNARRYPASLTKMMTLYLLFEAMQAGRVTPNTPIPVSAYAAARPPTKIGFKAGQTIPAELAAKALITKSANDVATAIGEYLGGSEQRFAQIMTVKARRLGMMNTNFSNASGLPDTQNYSTARDLAILSLALREHFPNQYKWFKTTSFQFRGQTVNGHNRLVKNMKGVDGIKTGYTSMSGSNLATSMRIDGRSIVAVVMGGRSSALRDAHMAELLRRYLPEASRSKTRAPLIAATQYDLPQAHDAPIPVAKADVMPKQDNVAQVLTALTNVTQKQSPAVAEVNKFVAPTPAQNTKGLEAIDPVVTASAATNTNSTATGWAIQIASLPNEKQATEMLASAVNAARPALAKVRPDTQIFDKDGQRYYRARFTGFDSKKAAWDACSALKKANFNCYA